MTRLWVISDLHLDYSPLDGGCPIVPDADVAVVAGDLGGGGIGPSINWLTKHVLPYMPVVFVPGNHEFYGTDMIDELKHLRQAKLSRRLPAGLHVLDCDTVDVAGVRFLGCTLWTDFRLGCVDGDQVARAKYDARYHINDYRAIRHGMERLTPEHTSRLHTQHRGWLTDLLAEPGLRQLPYVAVTHHAPSPWSVHIRYRDSALNGSFVSDMDELLQAIGPDLWIHGHVHDSFDYVVGDTRVVCNPRGYGDENRLFDPQLVLEVGPQLRLRC